MRAVGVLELLYIARHVGHEERDHGLGFPLPLIDDHLQMENMDE